MRDSIVRRYVLIYKNIHFIAGFLLSFSLNLIFPKKKFISYIMMAMYKANINFYCLLFWQFDTYKVR